MISEALTWTLERARKGIEFEIEGYMVKAGTEVAPHACMTILGCTLVQAQASTVAIAGGALVVVLIIRQVRKRRQASDTGWSDCGEP